MPTDGEYGRYVSRGLPAPLVSSGIHFSLWPALCQREKGVTALFPSPLNNSALCRTHLKPSLIRVEHFSQGKLVCFTLCLEQQLLLCRRLLAAADYFHKGVYKSEQPVAQLISYQDKSMPEVPARPGAGLRREDVQVQERADGIRVPEESRESTRLLMSLLYLLRLNPFLQERPAYF